MRKYSIPVDLWFISHQIFIHAFWQCACKRGHHIRALISFLTSFYVLCISNIMIVTIVNINRQQFVYMERMLSSFLTSLSSSWCLSFGFEIYINKDNLVSKNKAGQTHILYVTNNAHNVPHMTSTTYAAAAERIDKKNPGRIWYRGWITSFHRQIHLNKGTCTLYSTWQWELPLVTSYVLYAQSRASHQIAFKFFLRWLNFICFLCLYLWSRAQIHIRGWYFRWTDIILKRIMDIILNWKYFKKINFFFAFKKKIES